MKIYNEHIENFGVRVIYLFNTINSFCVLATIFSLGATYLVTPFPIAFLPMVGAAIVIFALMKIADWHPYYVPVALLSLIFLFVAYMPDYQVYAMALAGVAFFYLGVLLVINGGPQVIVGRDLTIPFRMLALCFTSVVPTTLSLPISVFFGYLLTSSVLMTGHVVDASLSLIPLLGALAVNVVGALVVRKFLPDNLPANQYRPSEPIATPFKKVVILNIDGARWDLVSQMNLPTLTRVMSEGSHVENGLLTVYRALTNPAFGTILTGARPQEHGIFDNNLGQSLKVEGLGDLVKITIYGCMHMNHFAKDRWETKIVSLPKIGIQKSDDVAMEWLLDDLRNDKKTRLFVFDYSEADFCGHSYGGKSKQYKEALRKVDERIAKVLEVIESLEDYEDTAVIICSDHGMHNLDHGYRIFRGESYVPCLFWGKRIKAGHVVEKDGMINDIGLTAAWMLGQGYPANAQGQVFDEVAR
ncbi:alkaline phosphatase family protein [Rhizobium leucaenae]|uniref:alkaline phosphatase family protein n=1 Tax=Rhizobium leucaenae TaxID=29450 RepID=UPI0007EE6D96|nr:alkaline phosphatase family protein [Rhizobium leucaenae]